MVNVLEGLLTVMESSIVWINLMNTIALDLVVRMNSDVETEIAFHPAMFVIVVKIAPITLMRQIVPKNVDPMNFNAAMASVYRAIGTVIVLPTVWMEVMNRIARVHLNQ